MSEVKRFPGQPVLSQIVDVIPSSIIYAANRKHKSNRYRYDKIGNLVEDKQEKLKGVFWNVYGKISRIEKPDLNQTIVYDYDASGNRIRKRVTTNGATESTWYVRDAQGNVMAIYNGTTPAITESHIYGSSRLGMYKWSTSGREYELTNHLGNVLATISDTKVPVSSDGINIDYYEAGVLTAQDYYAFGGLMPGRKGSEVSRYGFGGQEMSNEVKGHGKSYTAEFWEYDPRIGRRWNVDPLAHKMPGWSPYSFCFNNPLIFVDPDGQYPIYILTRAYAPFPTFGSNNNWYGDNRGHTLDRGASYRALASINYDTETKKTQAFGGHSRSHTVDGRKDAISPTLVSNRTKEGSNFLDVHSAGTNAAQFGAQPIDQFTKLTVTTEGDIKKDHVLSIKGTVSGDDFPNQESMVYDSKGIGLWLGNYETKGDRNSGPVWNLFFENEADVHINVDIRIKVNADGVFQGIMQKGKDGKETMISISDWNKNFKSDDNK